MLWKRAGKSAGKPGDCDNDTGNEAFIYWMTKNIQADGYDLYNGVNILTVLFCKKLDVVTLLSPFN